MTMKLLLATLCVGFITATALAQGRATPRFEDYPATVYRGGAAQVNVKSMREARRYRTVLREGAKKGVNFAGHYTVVQWGCGTGCMQAAIIDTKTGVVFFPEEVNGFGVWFWDENNETRLDDAPRFKPNSRLMVMSGFPASEGSKGEPKSGLYYYEWTGRRLRLVKLVEKKREMGR
jgi:hypothetical protein